MRDAWEADMNPTSGHIFGATISGVWVAVGIPLILCGAICLVGIAAGWGNWGTSTLSCGGACAVVGAALVAAGALLMYFLKTRRVNTI